MTPSPPVHKSRPASVNAGLVVLGACLIAAAARLEIPMVPVPMTMQTYAVLVIGMLLGWRLGAATVVAYLAAAAIGIPVLAGGDAGLDRLLGPTAGYLGGFVAAAILVGWLAQRGWASGLAPALAAMALGHAVVLGLGATWLAFHIGWKNSVAMGLTPFALGAAVKSALAAITVEIVRRLLPRRLAASRAVSTPRSR